MTTKPKKPAPPIQRRDSAGHLDPAYAADLLAKGHVKEKPDDAFLHGARSKEPVADMLGREFVETVTSAEDEGTEVEDEVSVEESGGPFVETTGKTEFAHGTDASNPKRAKREPFPKT